MQKHQGISILFFSRQSKASPSSILFFSPQSKARPRQAVIAKWQAKQWIKKEESVQGRDQRNKFSAVSRESQGSKASRSARPHGTASK